MLYIEGQCTLNGVLEALLSIAGLIIGNTLLALDSSSWKAEAWSLCSLNSAEVTN